MKLTKRKIKLLEEQLERQLERLENLVGKPTLLKWRIYTDRGSNVFGKDRTTIYSYTSEDALSQAKRIFEMRNEIAIKNNYKDDIFNLSNIRVMEVNPVTPEEENLYSYSHSHHDGDSSGFPYIGNWLS